MNYRMIHQLLELGPTDQSASNPAMMSAYRDEIAKAQSAQNKVRDVKKNSRLNFSS